MQAGLIASARGRSGRQLRFFAILVMLLGVNIGLWARVAADLAAENTLDDPATGLAALAALAAFGMAFAVWRNPISRNVRTMTTPALRQALATHHAGHAVAAYLDDPNRLRRIDLSAPCNLHPPEVPVVTQTALRSQLGVALAGMTAEEIFAGESGSHSAADLARATDFGVDMVGQYGMAGSLVSLGGPRQRRGKFINRVLDDARTRKELEALMRECKRDTVRSMLESRHMVIAVRDALMRNNRIDAARAREIIAGAEQQRHTGDQVLVDLHVVGSRPIARAREM
jgi:hypothetical protein